MNLSRIAWCSVHIAREEYSPSEAFTLVTQASVSYCTLLLSCKSYTLSRCQIAELTGTVAVCYLYGNNNRKYGDINRRTAVKEAKEAFSQVQW